MPNITSAKKALRVSARKRVHNEKRKNAMKSVVKSVKKAIGEKNIAQAESFIASAYQAIDKAVKRGVIKKNTGARKKSRLVALVKKSK